MHLFSDHFMKYSNNFVIKSICIMSRFFSCFIKHNVSNISLRFCERKMVFSDPFNSNASIALLVKKNFLSFLYLKLLPRACISKWISSITLIAPSISIFNLRGLSVHFYTNKAITNFPIFSSSDFLHLNVFIAFLNNLILFWMFKLRLFIFASLFNRYKIIEIKDHFRKNIINLMESKTCSMCNIENNMEGLYKHYTECKNCNCKQGLKVYYENEDNISNQRKI